MPASTAAANSAATRIQARVRGIQGRTIAEARINELIRALRKNINEPQQTHNHTSTQPPPSTSSSRTSTTKQPRTKPNAKAKPSPSISRRKNQPKTTAASRMNSGNRVWIKESAIAAAKNSKLSFQEKLAAKQKNAQTKKAADGASSSRSTASWGWKPGCLVESSGFNITVSVEDETEPLVLPATAMSGGNVVTANEYEVNKHNQHQPVCPDDLISLTHLHEPAVVECLEFRYEANHIYTSTGPVLLALNPFKRISGLYDEATMERYWNEAESTNGQETAKLSPHIYAIADAAFRTMQRALETDGDSTPHQSILVSGESGAGKTVTTKFAMTYLAKLSQRAGGGNTIPQTTHKPSIEAQVLQSNPILESFGNARTIRNDNSSRFGKFLELQFTRQGTLVGASIEVYLLEQVRLIQASTGERNYHVFYELLSDPRERQRYHLPPNAQPKDFKLTATGTYDRRDGVQDRDTYQELRDAMKSMEFSPTEQHDIFGIVAAMLHASNLTFVESSGGSNKSQLDETNPHLSPVCELLGITPKDLNRALCHATIRAGGQNTTIQTNLTADQARKGVEALLKTTYGTLFAHLVSRVNDSISCQPSSHSSNHTSAAAAAASPAASIGVLDIFGFESFQTNSFEQLCINYCNEALQQQFNSFVLENEQKEYEREGIQWSFIDFPDNQDVLDLIGKHRTGILAILDDQCQTPGATDAGLCREANQRCRNHARFAASRQQGRFSVHHYAGRVEYRTEGFLEKNRDELPQEATELLRNSTKAFVRKLAGRIQARNNRCGGSGNKNETAATTTTGSFAPRKKPKAKETVGGEFRRQLRQLREKIDRMTPHYVRCLKPNDELVPDAFHKAAIVEQLRCGGIIEAVRVARAGFSNHFSHGDFVRRYRSLAWRDLQQRARRPRRPRLSSSATTRKAPGPSARDCQDLVRLLGTRLNTESEENQAENETAEKASKGKKFLNKFGGLSSELAKVGMQFGKTKVFLRHTAFERLERIRAQEHARAAVRLNSVFRMFLARRTHGTTIRNVVLRSEAIDDPEQTSEFDDPTFNKESMERYVKNREAFSGKAAPGPERDGRKPLKPFKWGERNGLWVKIELSHNDCEEEKKEN